MQKCFTFINKYIKNISHVGINYMLSKEFEIILNWYEQKDSQRQCDKFIVWRLSYNLKTVEKQILACWHIWHIPSIDLHSHMLLRMKSGWNILFIPIKILFELFSNCCYTIIINLSLHTNEYFESNFFKKLNSPPTEIDFLSTRRT